MNKASKLLCTFALAWSVLGSGTAQADIMWRTTPLLGTAYTPLSACPANSSWINCATLTTDAGTMYVSASTDPLDPLFGSGLPSQPIFQLDQTAYAASSVDKPTGGSYDITFMWSYLGPYSSWNSGVIDEGIDTNSGTVVNAGNGWIFNDYPNPSTPDGGLWNYTETWTNVADPADFISASTSFCVSGQGVTCVSATSVPEPASLTLLGLGLAGLGCSRRKRS